MPTISPAQPIVQPTTGALTPLSAAEVRVTGGFWGDLQNVNAQAVIAHCQMWMARIGWIGNFDRAASKESAWTHAGVEFVDSEVYKLIEAMASELARQPNGALQRDYDDLVRRVVGAQDSDGYLHTAFGRPGQPPRYSNMEFGHELYCFGHFFQAAVARLRSGNDDELPAAARRLADHVVAEFGPDGRPAIDGHPEIEMGLVELGRATGQRQYILQAARFLERRGHRTLATNLFQGSDYFLDDVPIREANVFRGHAVRAVYLGAGATDVAVETGDHGLLQAVARQWATTVARRTYLTGGLGAHHQNEAFGDDYELPADRAYAETCAAIGSVMLTWRLQLATGAPEYADLIERTLLNAVLVGPRADGRAFFYANTLHQREPGIAPADDALSERAESGLRAPWFEVSCCPTNIARTLAQISGYFATKDDTGVQLHQYGTYDVDTELTSGQRVRLSVETSYPLDGQVTVRIAEPGRYVLRLRIPEWAEDVSVESPGMVQTARHHIAITADFEIGDRIDLQLPMPLRTITADPRVDAVRGTVAFERGPLVQCIESTDLPPGVDLNALALIEPSTGESTTVTLHAVQPSSTSWPYGSPAGTGDQPSITVPLRPYAGWGNRGPSAMRVWVPTDFQR